MKKKLFLAVTFFCCSTTLTLAQDNSAFNLDGLNNEATIDNKPLVNSKLVHADPDSDMVLIDGLRLSTCKIRRTTPEMTENLKKMMLSSNTSLGKDF